MKRTLKADLNTMWTKKDQNGFSLISTIISVGIASFLAIATVQMFKNMKVASKSIEQSVGYNTVRNNILNLLKNPDSCVNTAQGINLSLTSAQAIQIKNVSGNVLLEDNTTFPGLKVDHVRATATGVTTGVYQVEIEVKLRKIGGLASQAGYAGSTTFTDTYIVNVVDTGASRVCNQGEFSVVNLETFSLASAPAGKSALLVITKNHAGFCSGANHCIVDLGCVNYCEKDYVPAGYSIKAKGNLWRFNVAADSSSYHDSGTGTCAWLKLKIRDLSAGTATHTVGYNCGSQLMITNSIVVDSIIPGHDYVISGVLGYNQFPLSSTTGIGWVGSTGMTVSLTEFIDAN